MRARARELASGNELTHTYLENDMTCHLELWYKINNCQNNDNNWKFFFFISFLKEIFVNLYRSKVEKNCSFIFRHFFYVVHCYRDTINLLKWAYFWMSKNFKYKPVETKTCFCSEHLWKKEPYILLTTLSLLAKCNTNQLWS